MGLTAEGRKEGKKGRRGKEKGRGKWDGKVERVGRERKVGSEGKGGRETVISVNHLVQSERHHTFTGKWHKWPTLGPS